MDIESRIKRAIVLRKDDVFLRAEFNRFGSPAQVGRSLRHLVDAGKLVKLGKGVYAKAKPNILNGQPIPVQPVDYLVPQALRKLGIRVQPTQAVRDYNEGRTTQIPMGFIVNTGNRRVSRRLGFGPRFVSYENT